MLDRVFNAQVVDPASSGVNLPQVHAVAEIRHAEATRMELARVAGVNDAKLVDDLLNANISAESFPAFLLFPSAYLAWADGRVSLGESGAVIIQSASQGLQGNSKAIGLLQSWLDSPPSVLLWNLWKEYAAARKTASSPDEAKAFRESTLSLATVVATAAGGLFGFGTICGAEQKIINEMHAVL